MYLGIDLGTGSVKLKLVDRNGHAQVVSQSYPIEAPHPGYAETDPAEWVRAIREGLSSFPDLSGLRGIGFSGQMHGVVPLDAEGQTTIGRAILWADQRSGGYLHHIRDLGPSFQARLLNAPASGMTSATLLWMRSERPADYARIRTVLFPKDYIRYLMTGTLATDHSDASGSLLYDFATRDWYVDAVRELGLDPALLPPIRVGVEQAGVVTAQGARLFGLPQGVPVAIGGADTPTGMFGAGLHDTASVQISVGTAAQVSRPIAADRLPAWNPALNVFEGIRATDRYQVAAMLNAGIALEWVRRVVKLSWQDIYAALQERDPAQAPDLLFVPHLGGERTPYMNPDARGAWLGLGLHHTDVDMAYAAMIGVAFTIRQGLETLGTDGVREVRAVGGSLQFEYWRTLLASVLGRSLTIFEQTDIGSHGAVRIACEMLGETLTETDAPPRVYEGVALPWADEHYDRFKAAYRVLEDFRQNGGHA